jgi:hypothetical protein
MTDAMALGAKRRHIRFQFLCEASRLDPTDALRCE